MATTKITDLTAYTDPVNTDVLPIVDVTSDVTKKVSIANVMKNASLGTAAAPGIAFDGDPNTGIYSPGANQVAITTDGTQRMLIDSAGAVTIAGDLTVNGTTTNINTQNLVVEDKNIVLGDVTTPTDVTADGGGITLKGATDKTINWVDSTDAWTSSERFSYPTGSAAAPTLTFTGDPNTGIYSPGADQVAISTNGQGRLFIGTTGAVGINNSSPSVLFHVTGTTGYVLAADGTTSGTTLGVFSDASYTKLIAVNNARSSFAPLVLDGSDTRFLVSGTERLRITSTGALNFVGAGTAGVTQAVSFNGSAPANSLVIDSSGRLGVGTSSPSKLLTIGTSSTANTTVRLNCSQTAGSDTGMYSFGIDDSTDFAGMRLDFTDRTSKGLQIFTAPGFGYPISFSGSSGNQDVTIDASGRVGIGTASPGSLLEVYRGTIALNANASTDTTKLSWKYGGTEYQYIQRDNATGGLAFGDNISERMRLDASGRLLVGTSTNRNNLKTQVEGTTSETASLSVFRNSNDANPAILVLGKSRGTSVNSKTVVSSGDRLGIIAFHGSDGTQDVEGAYIETFVDGTPGANDMPSRLVFSTTGDGSASPTERGRIINSGYWKISNSGAYNYGTRAAHEIRTDNNDWNTIFVNSHVSGPYGINLYYSNASPNGTGNEFIACTDSSFSRFVARSNGGLANYQANNVNLSDINTKKDISPAVGTWDCIKEWEIVNYRYKDQPDDADLNIGVIAQQVAESCPEVITIFQEAKEATEDQPAQEERLGIKEQQMYWMAIKALQEAQVRIEALEATNADLLARVIALESA